MNRIEDYPNAANLSGNTGFPFFIRDAYNGVFSKGDIDLGILHWHEDLQFIYVLEGKALVKTLEDERLISAGEAIFTNSGVVHYSICKSAPCHYKLFRFPEQFITFYMGSPAETLTRSITKNPAVSLVTLTPEQQWCKEALLILKKLSEPMNSQQRIYPYEVLCHLTQLWLIMLKNIESKKSMPESIIGQRMRIILEYINEHYDENLTLDDLAASCNISKSEILRCFKATLQTTPYRYLMDYRIKKAADLLAEKELSIGEIAALTGFHQQSYFGKCFRERFNCSPSEYRKSNLHFEI